MSVLRGDLLSDRAGPPGRSAYAGWRLAVNRFLWRAFILLTGRFVVVLERVVPGRGYGARVAAAGARAMCALMGVRVQVRGLRRLDGSRGFLFAANHRGAMDIAALMAALPGARFAAKVEAFSDPVLGAPMRALGMIPIDRADPERARRALADAAARLGRSVSVVMFPEGTYAPPGQMLPFKGGAFAFAIQAGLPVVPVAVHGSAAVMPDDGRITIAGGRIVVEILDPIPTRGMSEEDRTPLKDQVRKAIVEALRPLDGGVAERRDLGSLRRRALGVRAPIGK